jgi:hypothetical protein
VAKRTRPSATEEKHFGQTNPSGCSARRNLIRGDAMRVLPARRDSRRLLGDCQSPAGLSRRALCFVLCAQKKVRWQLCKRRCFGERTAGEEMVSAPAYLGVQPVAEKIPVNFLLFTGKANFALLRVVPEWQPDPTGLDLVRTVSSSAAAACLSSAPGGHPRAQTQWLTT